MIGICRDLAIDCRPLPHLSAAVQRLSRDLFSYPGVSKGGGVRHPPGLWYLFSIVHKCLQLSSFCDENSFHKRARRATHVHICRRLCASCSLKKQQEVSAPTARSSQFSSFHTLQSFHALHLATQCEIPPHIARYPFEIVSQRGVSHLLALFS